MSKPKCRVPVGEEATECRSSEFKGGFEVVEVVKGGVFDAEVANYKREGDVTGMVAEQRGSGGLVASSGGEVADKTVLGQKTGVF